MYTSFQNLRILIPTSAGQIRLPSGLPFQGESTWGTAAGFNLVLYYHLTEAMSVPSETPAEKQQPLAAGSNPNPVPAERSVPRAHDHPSPHAEHCQSHPTTSAPPNRRLYEWTARIECNKFELGGSYSVLIFLGHVPDDPQEWQVLP
jgi:tyrosinase